MLRVELEENEAERVVPRVCPELEVGETGWEEEAAGRDFDLLAQEI